MYKNLLRFSALALLVVACFDVPVTGPDRQIVDGIDLGKPSLTMSILNMPKSAPPSVVQVEVMVTAGAKYAAQVLDLEGRVVVSRGFTATDMLEVVELDCSALPPGSYDVTLADVTGKTRKRPLVIVGR